MARVTLLNLETLCCIAKFGTFAAAADKMHASQPAISARIRDMEIAMGVTLFQRQGRRMELTPQGRELVQMVEPVLRRLRGAVDAIDSVAATTGHVRIGVGEFAAVSWFPVFMARLRELMPQVTWQVDVELTGSLTEKLKAGKLDIAFLAGPVVGADIRSVSVGRVRMIWAAAPSLVNAATLQLSEADRLQSQVIWTLPSPSATHTATMAVLHDYGVSPEAICTCTHTVALVDMVAAGAGVALLPEVLIRGRLASSQLVSLLPGAKAPEIEFVVAWHSTSEQPVIRQIIENARLCSSFEKEDGRVGP